MPAQNDVPVLLANMLGISTTDEPALLAQLNGRATAGRMKQSDATILYGLPGVAIIGSTTQALSINQVIYQPLFPLQNIIIDSYMFEVTAAPASNANVRTGIYLADAGLQPTGTPLLDDGVAVASGFTGVKTVSSLSVSLKAFTSYVAAVNCDVAMTLRIANGNSLAGGFLATALGATPNIVDVHAVQAYGTYASLGASPTQWSAVASGTTAFRHFQFFRWS